MRVSLNTVRKFTDIDVSVDELVEKINQQLGGVDEVIDLGERYADCLIVRIVSCQKHENADKLSVCLVDDGGVRTEVERDENGLVRVVCGAPNVKPDMFAVWLPPQSIVPSSWDETERFVLSSRELRGVVSHGMLASPKELALGESHDGILEIAPDEPTLNGATITAGAKFGQVFELDDTVIDIENKMFTHRPDLFGQLGVAREIAGIQHKTFLEPDWYWSLPVFDSGAGLEIAVDNQAPEHVSRLMAVALKDVEIKPSPLWLQAELVRLGSKPINNVVDATNYIMLLTAQPVHAYDYDKLRGHTLISRLAKQGETVTLLNGKTYQLDESDIVIADSEGPIGLAGIMGGGESEVTAETRNILLEVATFDMYAVRKSSMRHGVFTDALARFNKGQSPLQNDRVLAKLIDTLTHVSSGTLASDVADVHQLGDVFADQTLSGTIAIQPNFVTERLGLDISDDEISGLLRNVHFSCHAERDAGELSVTAPFWRTDIELPEDIVEEVGRLYGFDKLPRELPERTMKPVTKNSKVATKSLIRQTMRQYGANEVLTYSFVHENVLRKAEQNIDEAFKLSNALSPDLQYYRLTVLPSLLDKVRMNIKSGHDEFVLYEIGKGHNKVHHRDDDEGLPAESEFVDMVYAAKRTQPGAAFYRARQYVEKLCQAFGREVVFLPVKEQLDYPVTAPFDLSRAAMVHVADTNEFVGMIGEFKQSVRRNYKLPDYVAGATLDFAAFQAMYMHPRNSYVPLSRYPSVMQDVSLEVHSTVLFEDLFTLAKGTMAHQANERYRWSMQPISIYQATDSEQKVVTLRLTIADYTSTLKDNDVKAFIDAIVHDAAEAYGAVQK